MITVSVGTSYRQTLEVERYDVENLGRDGAAHNQDKVAGTHLVDIDEDGLNFA
jgi:hypothetical protein